MPNLSKKKLTVRLINHRPFRTTISLLVLSSFLIGLLIVPVESSNRFAPIKTVEDGLWWAVTTITGVGYGDMYPTSTEGRLLGAILQISGVLIFGLLIGIIGITMTKTQEEYSWFRLFERLDALETKLEKIEKKNEFLVKEQLEKSSK